MGVNKIFLEFKVLKIEIIVMLGIEIDILRKYFY